jgi:2-amino-4-hydroxy-6-hydroxymethyldihydropteridine diphosphokinase
MTPLGLLDALQEIERRHGRTRAHRNAPRTLDLDLLLHGDEQLSSARLTLPHPRLAERAFVLAPLLEVAPELRTRYAQALSGLAHQRVERLP